MIAPSAAHTQASAMDLSESHSHASGSWSHHWMAPNSRRASAAMPAMPVSGRHPRLRESSHHAPAVTGPQIGKRFLAQPLSLDQIAPTHRRQAGKKRMPLLPRTEHRACRAECGQSRRPTVSAHRRVGMRMPAGTPTAAACATPLENLRRQSSRCLPLPRSHQCARASPSPPTTVHTDNICATASGGGSPRTAVARSTAV